MRITRHLGHSCRILIGTSILLTWSSLIPGSALRKNASQKKGDAKDHRTMLPDARGSKSRPLN